jgi:FlaA1/EpsC-like NDP-sugar epimerase
MALQAIKFGIDLLLGVAFTPLAFLLRFEHAWASYSHQILLLVTAGLFAKGFAIWAFGMHRRSWSKVSLRDLENMALGILFVTVFYAFIAFSFQSQLGIPRSIPFIEAILALVFLGGVRVIVRLFWEHHQAVQVKGTSHRTLIAGAGEAGTMIARELLRHPESGLVPVAFLDDDPGKRIESYMGLKVKGTIADLPRVAREVSADIVLIAIPSAPGDVVRHIVDLAKKAKLEYRIIPGIYEILSGDVSVSQIREVDLEDLLRRDPVRLDTGAISGYLVGQTVLVTGAGGSIGSEIVRQVARFRPEKVLLLGRGENSLFNIQRELAVTHPELDFQLLVCDVRDEKRLAYLFGLHLPDVVFHAAAHKHVPMMEENPDEAILNNVFGTRNLAELALEYGVTRFVNISTDKAVNPTSVMGASKRIAEKVVKHASGRCEEHQAFVSVRFGNVLGSRGSVVPTFKEQIRRGGPVTVTHPDMTRYFMTIPEAAQLVLQAGGQAQNGSVYVLDMGEPVKILDLASDLVRLSGFEPGRDIPITFTGLRRGEKLYEELLTAEEGVTATHHKKIHVANNGVIRPDFEENLEKVRRAALTRDEYAIKRAIHALVPTFQGVPSEEAEAKTLLAV